MDKEIKPMTALIKEQKEDALREIKMGNLGYQQLKDPHDELLERLKTCNDWINRAKHMLTSDQQGYCGFLSQELVKEAIAKAEREIMDKEFADAIFELEIAASILEVKRYQILKKLNLNTWDEVLTEMMKHKMAQVSVDNRSSV